jgi:hypothetical protein
MPFRRLLSLRSEGQTRCGNQGGPGMKCPACGAEMHLMKVAPDKPMMVPGYEEHTFECSGCHDQVRRLVFIPRAIEPLTNAQMPRLPPARLKRPVDGATSNDAWSRALEAVARVNAMYVGGALIAIGLAGSMVTWGQGLKGPLGDRGPPGPKGATGDPGPPSAVSSVRIVRSNCDERSCRVQCGENEMLLTAYCGAKRNPAIIPTERAATCRVAGPANSPLLAVCARIEP